MSHARQRALSCDDKHDGLRSQGHENLRNSVPRGRWGASAWAFCLLAAVPACAETLEDSANRKVELPAHVGSVVPAGPPAQVLLQALAPDRLAGLVEPFKPEHAIYVDPRIAALPQIPMLSRTNAPADIAAVAALKPDLSVDYGNVSARFISATEKIGSELKIPAVIFSGDLGETATIATKLGGAIGAGDRAKLIADSVETVIKRVQPVSDLSDADRVSVYVARGADGLQAFRGGSAFDQPIRLAGGRNVVSGGGGPFAHLTVADVVALKPSVVVFAESEAMSSPLHDALPRDTKFVLDAGEPYKVLAGPPSINRVVGLLALATLLHPDKVKADPDEIKRLATTLFPIPAGLAEPAPLQLRQ